MEEVLIFPVLCIVLYFAYKGYKQDMQEIQNMNHNVNAILNKRTNDTKTVRIADFEEVSEPPSYTSVITSS
tara:strand:+ start:2193 stop:2405 length:213 start_codon:yes stop_codon:yes gene_type:complete